MIKFKLDDKEFEIDSLEIKIKNDYFVIRESDVLSLVHHFHNRYNYDLDDFCYMTITDDKNNIYFMNNINSGNLVLKLMKDENVNKKKTKSKKNEVKKNEETS